MSIPEAPSDRVNMHNLYMFFLWIWESLTNSLLVSSTEGYEIMGISRVMLIVDEAAYKTFIICLFFSKLTHESILINAPIKTQHGVP